MDFLSVVPQKTKEARSSTLMFAFGFSLLIYLWRGRMDFRSAACHLVRLPINRLGGLFLGLVASLSRPAVPFHGVRARVGEYLLSLIRWSGGWYLP